jgi:hypothetical protein
MAYILWNKGEQSLINTWLGGYNPGTNGVPSNAFYVGLGKKTDGVGSSKEVSNGTTGTTIFEIGQTTTGGYARQPIYRGGVSTSWPVAAKSGGSFQSTAPQVNFTFTGAPNANGATLWFVALGSAIGGDDCLFGADLATTRTFADGDTERITITYRQT